MQKTIKCESGLRVILVLVVLIMSNPIFLSAFSNEEQYAQDLVSMAEERLAQGKTEEALRMAEIVISEFPDTRAVHKAKEIKQLAGSDSAETIPLTRSSAAAPPDPQKACLWGLIPGVGQFYTASYYSKTGDKKRAGMDYFMGAGTLVSVPVASFSALIGLSQASDPMLEESCLYQNGCLIDNQCIGDYQTTCLIIGIGSAIAVPVLWGGSAYSAWSTAKRIQKGDTLESDIPCIK